ncbi:hypothetical protein PV387_17045 [Streptomyces sp. ME02-6987-2C]|nr:hypothetical protein [Streptomyces lividans]MDX3367723.1 hypothetical protein [Streptomyces sp. ME02-6987-2C]
MVIVVIGVLACVLSGYGLELSSVLAVLGGAGLVAADTLTAVRGAGKRLHRSAVQAVTALAAG